MAVSRFSSTLRSSPSRLNSSLVSPFTLLSRGFSVSAAPAAKAAIAFDIDGVLVRGKVPIPGAADALRLLDSHDFPYILLTNGGGGLEKHKAESTSKTLGYEIDSEKVILSHTPMKDLAKLHEDDLLLLSGRSRVREIADHYGFKNYLTVDDVHAAHPTLYPDTPPVLSEPARTLSDSEKIKAVLVLMDPLSWEKELQILSDVLRSDGALHSHVDTQEVHLYMASSDFLYAGEAPLPRFGSGAFQHVLDSLYHRLTGSPLEITQFGKPFPRTYSYAENALKTIAANKGSDSPIASFWGIGDNPETDIAGANAAGDNWKSVLVMTGLAAEDDPVHRADVVKDDVMEAVQHILEVEGY